MLECALCPAKPDNLVYQILSKVDRPIRKNRKTTLEITIAIKVTRAYCIHKQINTRINEVLVCASSTAMLDMNAGKSTVALQKSCVRIVQSGDTLKQTQSCTSAAGAMWRILWFVCFTNNIPQCEFGCPLRLIDANYGALCVACMSLTRFSRQLCFSMYVCMSF